MDIKIDKNSELPIYRQIIEQITSMVTGGSLKPGDRLPPERELAEQIGIARGTINKAYEELEKSRVVRAVQGSGSFISEDQDILDKGRKEKAISMIDGLLSSLEEQNFTYREIAAFVNIRLLEREKRSKRARIGAVDCNPEALEIFKNQLSYISNLEFVKFLLEDVRSRRYPPDVFEGFDLILTTSTHYNELNGMLPDLRGKIVRAAVSPSRQTIIDLASMPVNMAAGIICRSAKFLEIIQQTLKSFDVDINNVEYFFDTDCSGGELAGFINAKSVLIAPPESVTGMGTDTSEMLNAFRSRGGVLIRFDYQIDRGSLIYIEEQIYDVFNRK